MSVYDRAPRKIDFKVGETSCNVGPGSYDFCHMPVKCEASAYEGYAPFNILASREQPFEGKDPIPGPGDYNPQLPVEYIKSVSAFRSGTRRFSCNPDNLPGPGAYELNNPWKKPPPTVVNKCDVEIRKFKYKRRPGAPSVPCRGQTYGYEENEDGTLKKQLPPEMDTTLGPAYYQPTAYEDALPTRMYKGIHWSSMKSGRTRLDGMPGPAPGDYDPYPVQEVLRIRTAPCDDRAGARDSILEKPQSSVGPGQYRIVREFDQPIIPRRTADGRLIEAPFSFKAQRFKPTVSMVPPPGSYDDPRDCLEALKKVTGLKHSPFGQTASRFIDTRSSKLPAPNAYLVRGLSEEWAKNKTSQPIHGAFNSTTERMSRSTERDTPYLPGPAHYDPPKDVKCARLVRLSSPFASQGRRILTDEAKEELPPPGAYDVVESFRKTQTKTELRPARSEEGRKRREAFKSSTARFSQPRDMIVAEREPCAPGPGQYDPREVKYKVGNRMTTRGSRFHDPDAFNTPAPNAYVMPPLIQDTVLKGTFNVTLSKALNMRTNMESMKTNTNLAVDGNGSQHAPVYTDIRE